MAGSGTVRLCLILTTIFSMTAALILGFFCLFAGYRQNSLENYHIITLELNSTTLIANAASKVIKESDNLIGSFGLDDIPGADNVIEEIAKAIEEKIDIDEFISYHVLTLCFGEYNDTDPSPNPNTKPGTNGIDVNATNTLPRKQIDHCTSPSTTLNIDLKNVVNGLIRRATSKVGGIVEDNTDQLIEYVDNQSWFDDLDKWTRLARALIVAFFSLFLIGIAFAFITLLLALISSISIFKSRRNGGSTKHSHKLSATLLNVVGVLSAITTFAAFAIASILVTIASKKGVSAANDKGGDFGVTASGGTKFMTLAWAATAVSAVGTIAFWARVGFCCGNVRKENAGHKYG